MNQTTMKTILLVRDSRGVPLRKQKSYKLIQTTTLKAIAVLLLFISASCFGQFPRKANVAILEAENLSASRLLTVCIDVLESEGFHLEELDRTSLTLITDSVVIHTLPLLFKLKIDVEGHMAAVRGYIKDNRDFASMGWQDIPQEWEEAAFRSFPGSTWRTGFKAVVRIVEEIRSRTSGKVQWVRW